MPNMKLSELEVNPEYLELVPRPATEQYNFLNKGSV